MLTIYTHMENICSQCNRKYVYDRKNGHRKTVCNSCNVTRFRKRRKEKCVIYKGGKCQKCGYNKCLGALQFHHLDPSIKQFGLSEKGIPKSWEKCKTELDKCILLCANCHAETHNNSSI